MLFRKSTYDWLLAGLGNPGSNYARTRHNVGFRALDLLAEAHGVRINRSKFQGLTAEIKIGEQKILLLEPQTFMNLSGQSVVQAAKYYKIPPERVIVIFDDISLPVGKLRVRPHGSAGGHNGIKSIIMHLASDQFPRVKVGVGAKPHPDYDLADWVLSNFTAQEEKELAQALRYAAEAAETIITSGTSEAMNRYNGK